MLAGVTSSNGIQTTRGTSLAAGQPQRGVERARTLAGRVLEHGHVQLAGLHRDQRVLRGVDAADDHVVHRDAGSLDRLDRTDGALVVVGEDRVERLARGQPVGHQVLGRVAAPVRGLTVDDPDEVAHVDADDVVHVLGALDRGLVRELAHDDVGAGAGAALAHRAEHLAHLEGFKRAGLDLVRRHDRLVVGQRVEVDRLAVHVDQRHAGRRRGIGHRLGGGGVDRVHDDRVHAGGHEVVDLVELAGHVVLRIFDLHVDSVHTVGVFLEPVAQDGEEVVVEERHGDADRLGHCDRGEQGGQAKGQGGFLHWVSPCGGCPAHPLSCLPGKAFRVW